MNNQNKKTNDNVKKAKHSANNNTTKEKKKKKRILPKILLVIFIILMLVAGYVTYKTVRNGGGLQGFLATMMGHNENTLADLDKIDFLIMGESLDLTDTIIACSYNPKTQEASMLSIPRDTFIGKNKDKPTGNDKINALYQGKYPEKTVEAVNKITGLNLKYYVVIDTKALRELVDAIGGVDFYVPINMNYDDTSKENELSIHLKEGQQKLNGDQAEQLVRFRHNTDGSTYPSEYGQEDIGRMRTQREFLTAVMKQTLKPGNVLKLGEFLEIAHKNVKTNIDLSVAKDYIPYAVNFNTENIKTETLPGAAIPPKAGYAWIYLPDQAESEKIVNDLFFNYIVPEDTEQAKSNSNISIEILNGSSDYSNLTKVTELLKGKGYNVTKVGNTTSTSKTSVVNRTKQSTEIVNNLTHILKYNKTSSGKDNADVDFTVIIGKDYK